MGRRDGNSLLKKNLIYHSEGNKENRYTITDPNETMINVMKEPSNVH
jgi:hypothetical protein